MARIIPNFVDAVVVCTCCDRGICLHCTYGCLCGADPDHCCGACALIAARIVRGGV